MKKIITGLASSALVLSLFMLNSTSATQANVTIGGASAVVANQTSADVLGTSVVSSLGLSTQVGL